MRIVIVGAGIVGLSIAEELTRRGISVELLEKGPQAGRESSWAAAGILTPQGEAEGPGPFLELLRRGFQLIPETVRRLEAATGIDIRYRAGGELAVAFSDSDEKELEREIAWQQEVGLGVERLNLSQIRKLEPALDGPIRWGLWASQTVQLDNSRLVAAYEQVAISQGAKIRTNAPVTRFLLEGDRVTGVETAQGRVEADGVVNCAGSWAGFDALLPFSIPTVPVRGQILQFHTDAPWFQRVVRSPRAYLVQRSPEILLAGTTLEYAGYEKKVTEEGRRSILAGARELTSWVSPLSPETAWAGLRPGTPDRLPILGATPFKGLWVAAGHFRNGILLAPLTGRLIADCITRGSCSIDLSPFSVDRFLARALSGARHQ